ncbi:MAG TPA: hypothetical protein VEA35_09865 [Ramlibacter sp.]|nr:hypothetical protein [Ramlibacter sp.]
MTSRLHAQPDALPRDKLLRTGLIVLAVVQMLAFYMLCSHQVRKQHARQTAVEVERMAQSDCLQYLSNSTIASCTSRSQQAQAAPQPENTAAGVQRANYAWR